MGLSSSMVLTLALKRAGNLLNSLNINALTLVQGLSLNQRCLFAHLPNLVPLTDRTLRAEMLR
jgi:hypothetical protein